MIKKKNQPEVKEVYGVNHNLLNIITPSGINYDSYFSGVGENIGKIFTISRYPTHVDYGWLANLCNLEGTSTSIEYRHTPSERMEKVLNKRIEELESEKNTKKQESERQKIEKAIIDLKGLVNRISVKGELVGYFNVLIHVQALNQKELGERLKRVRNSVASSNCNLRHLKYRQLQALQAISPYGIPNVKEVSNMGERNMPISTFFGGFPMANAGISDPNGFHLGKTKNNRMVKPNHWLRGSDRINSNWFISGEPGTGKSTLMKILETKTWALGDRIIIFDIEGEYIELANHPYVNGEVISGIGGKSKNNPLQITKVALVKQEELSPNENMNEFLQYSGEYGYSDMALYIQQLRTFFVLYWGKEDFGDAIIKATFEQCLIETYNKFNINWDTDIDTLSPQDYPTIKDLYDYVVEKEKDEENQYERNILRKLSKLLYSAAKGADSFLWNGYTTLELKKDFTVIDLSGLMELDENVIRAQLFLFQTWAWSECTKDERKTSLWVDEGYNYVDDEYPETMKYFRNFSKRIRKREGALIFATHAPADLLDPAVKRFGQAIIDNACYKFIFGSDGKNLDETAKLLKLTEAEITLLSNKTRAKGLFICGNTRLEVTVDARDEFLEIFGKGGGR